jgi:hypothetical protein
MNYYLLISGILTIFMGIAHSVIGEVLIISPIQKTQGLPPVRKSVRATKLTLRFTWHVTSVLGFGTAVILLYFSRMSAFNQEQIFILRTLSLTFLVSFLVSLIGSRARHPAWAIFLVISVLTWLSTVSA